MSVGVPIGKLRRPGLPGAMVSFDPSYGILIEGEDAPVTPAGAASFCKRVGGWVRFRKSVQKQTGPVRDFIKEYRRKK